MTDDIVDRTLAALDRPLAARRDFGDRLLERIEAEFTSSRPRLTLRRPLRVVAGVATIGLVIVMALGIGRLITSIRTAQQGAAATPAATPLADIGISESPVGGRPGALAFGEGGVWVADIPSGVINLLDSRTGAVLKTIKTGGGASSIAIGEGSIWVSDELANVVKRVDPQQGTVIATIPVATGPYGIAIGAGSVWVTHLSATGVSRIDPRTNSVVGTIRLGGRGLAQHATFALGSLWVSESADFAVYRIDPATSAAVRIPLDAGHAPDGLAFGAGAMWVVNTDSSDFSAVAKIDPASNRVVGSVDIGRRGVRLAVDRGSVWVACYRDNTLYQIDASSLQIVGQPIRVGAGPSGIVLGDRALWIGFNQSGSVGRLALP